MGNLTTLQVKAAAPKATPYKLGDGDALYLLVQPTGGKLWRLAYRMGGKQKTLALGSFPEVSLAEAREQRDTAKKHLKDGIDPATEISKGAIRRKRDVENEAARAQQEALEREKRRKTEHAFECIAREWHRIQSGKWCADHSRRVLERLERDVFPAIGGTCIEAVETPSVLAIVRAVEQRGAPDLAGRIKQHIEAVFRFADSIGIVRGHNPAASLKGVLQARKTRPRPALPEAEIPGFLAKLEAYQGDPVTRLGLRLALLTAVRTQELRGARWGEFDLERAEWRVPAERMKMKAEHIVPLSRQALAALEEIRPFSHGDLLFPGNDPRKPISENTMIFALYRMGYHSKCTVHGFRAMFSTIANERLDHKPDVIEAQLAHTQTNKVRAAYHRSEYLKERRQLMQDWADYLDGLKG